VLNDMLVSVFLNAMLVSIGPITSLHDLCKRERSRSDEGNRFTPLRSRMVAGLPLFDVERLQETVSPFFRV
jgi:hypothetical protein